MKKKYKIKKVQTGDGLNIPNQRRVVTEDEIIPGVNAPFPEFVKPKPVDPLRLNMNLIEPYKLNEDDAELFSHGYDPSINKAYNADVRRKNNLRSSYVDNFNGIATGVTGIANFIGNNKLKNKERRQMLESLEPRYWENMDGRGLDNIPMYTKYGGKTKGCDDCDHDMQAGGSIVDYLNSKGTNSSFDARGSYFKKHFGEEKYRGTAEQNIKLLNVLQKNKTVLPAPATGGSALASLAGDEKLESGVMVDKRTGEARLIENYKTVKKFPVLTGKNMDANYAGYSMDELDKNPSLRSTPKGSYLMNPASDIYGAPGFLIEGIPAFGENAPTAKNLAMHKTYDPKNRNKYYGTSQSNQSYGCINLKDCDMKGIVNTFPKGDTVRVLDSKLPKDRRTLSQYQSGGRPGGFVEAEAGEIVESGQGNITKISDDSNTHEQGGVKLKNVGRVLEDTGDKRKDRASKLLLISPEEVKGLFDFKVKRSVSHSKAFELATEHYNKKRDKIQRELKIVNEKPDLDKEGANSSKLNFNTLRDIPTKEDIMDALFLHQETVKDMNDIQDDGKIGKWGGKYTTKKAQAGIGDILRGDAEKYAKPITDTEGWTFLYTKGNRNYYRNVKTQQITSTSATTNPVKPGGNFGINDILNDPNRFKTFHQRMAGASAEEKRKAAEELYRKGTMPGTYSSPSTVTNYAYLDMNFPGAKTPSDESVVKDNQPLDTSATINPKFINQPDNKFHEPTYWDELAPGFLGLADSLRRDSELYNPVEFNQIRLKQFDPTATLNANQADYNAATDTIENMNIGSGAAASNIAGLQGQKYSANDQVLGAYDNQNVGVKNREIEYTAGVKDRQSLADSSTRKVYDTSVKLSREAQRQQGLKSVEDISRAIQLKRRQNRSGNLILKLSPAYDQYGEYNGYQYAPTLPTELGLDQDLPVVVPGEKSSTRTTTRWRLGDKEIKRTTTE